MRAEIALAKATDGGRATIKEPLIDWQRRRFVRAGMVERMNDSYPRAESEG